VGGRHITQPGDPGKAGLAALPIKGRDEKQRRRPDYKLASLPLAITGPVGWPVGEPPTGSIEIASVESAQFNAHVRAVRSHGD